MTDSFREKLYLLFIDKAVIGVVAFLVVWGLAERRHQQEVLLQRADLAGRLLPSIANSEWAADDRARLLATLVDVDAIRPQIVAQLAQQLIDAEVTRRVLLQSIRPSMGRDAEPFLQEAAYSLISPSTTVVGPAAPSACRPSGRRHTDSQRMSAGFSHWQFVFAVYAEPNGLNAAHQQLDSPRFLAESVSLLKNEDSILRIRSYRLAILASLLAPRSLEASRRLVDSGVLGIELIGHMASAVFSGTATTRDSQRSRKFVTRRLLRGPASDTDAALLLAELAVLANSQWLFGESLRGWIAVPLATLFSTSTKVDVRDGAGAVLLSMTDCAIDAASIVAEHLHGLLRELDAADEAWAENRYAGLETAARLLAGMEHEAATVALNSILEVPESRAHFLSGIKAIAGEGASDLGEERDQ